jgi:hypothetical protein
MEARCVFKDDAGQVPVFLAMVFTRRRADPRNEPGTTQDCRVYPYVHANGMAATVLLWRAYSNTQYARVGGPDQDIMSEPVGVLH